MPINASYEFLNAEKDYLKAVSMEDKIYWLEEMIRRAPAHKGGENLRAELRTRLKKFREKVEKNKKIGGGKKGIKKEGFQFAIIGLPNKGKSSILAKLTNAQPKVTDFPFSTRTPDIGTFDYEGVRAQIIDLPSLGSEYFDIGISNTADCLIIVVQDLAELPEVEKYLARARGKRIIVVNKSDLLNENELRKLEERMKSKRIEGIIFSAHTSHNLEKLKRAMFDKMNIVRVYTKEPGKPRTHEPIVLQKGLKVRDAAEKILKGFSQRVKETRLTGPSSKFPNQKVGLTHILKDLDVIEFHTK
jgi:ribosome-interacting GTPase 1